MKKISISMGLALAAVGCGPKMIKVQPNDVRATVVRPVSGVPEFCPGEAFQVEVVAEITTGDRCSSVVPGPCMGSSKALLDPKEVVVQSPLGSYDPQRKMMMPLDDALATAAGMVLEGWIVGAEPRKASTTLRPVYRCMQSNVYSGASGFPGEAGPPLDVAATVIRTPYYPRATLVRIASPWGVRYVMAPAGQRITIASRGGDGGQGYAGAAGSSGTSGASGGTCEAGGAGGPGGNGGPGGPGGDGGSGGRIVVHIDATAFDEIASVLDLESLGGRGGPGGQGGPGGAGGAGGSGGPSDPDKCPGGGTQGPSGPAGASGADGPAGNDGGNGPGAAVAAAPRESLFAKEMGKIQEIEK